MHEEFDPSARIRFPDGPMREALSRFDASSPDAEVYRLLGTQVVRQVVPRGQMEEWMAAWKDFQESQLHQGRNLNPYNPVVLQEHVSGSLAEIFRHPALLDLVRTFYPLPGLYLQRFLVKDVHNREPVFLHQDFSYNLGWPEKTSVMLPLSESNPENGGLEVFPGTHALGYLGDAGELDPEILDVDWPTRCPRLEPGDVLLMHDCLWHRSPARRTDVERIVVQITYQPAEDPSTACVLGDTPMPASVTLAGIARQRLFRRSRSSRIRELQNQVTGDQE